MKKEQELMNAAETGDIGKVSKLLNPKLFGIIKPVDVGVATESGWTLLMAAASNGHYDVAALLLEKGAKVDVADNEGFTALMGAAKYGFKDIAGLLLDQGADIHAAKTGDDIGENPLMFTAWQGHTDVAELLIRRGADVNTKTPNGYTAMMSAAKFGKLEMAHLLFEHGADIHAAKTGEDQGWNPIFFAAWKNHIEVVKWLIEKGADVNSRSGNQWSPLLFAVREGGKEVAELLLDAGSDINAVQKDGWSPLILAAFNGRDEILQMLVDRGADIHIIGNDHLNALETAIEKEFSDIAVTLIELGADVARIQGNGSTLLNKTIAKGRLNVATAILKTGKVDVNHADKNGVTALMKSAKAKNKKALELLLAHKADVNLKDNKGNTALDLVGGKKRNKAADLLKEAGAEYGVTPDAEKKDIKKEGLPQITAAVMDISLIDSSAIVPTGAGGSFFQDAIQCHNNQDEGGAELNFSKAVESGLDNLRLGYAFANLGALRIKKNKVGPAISFFMKVFSLGEVLYESAHDTAQYMAVIYTELDRTQEAALFEELAARTQSKLGYSLAYDAAEKVKKAVRSQKKALLGKPRKKKTVKADIKKSLRPLGNRKRLTHTTDESAHDAYLMLFNRQDDMERYYQAFQDYAVQNPPPVVLEVMTTYAPKTLFDEHYAFIFPHPTTDQREAYGLWVREATLTCNDQVGSDNHTSSRYNAIKTNVEKMYNWEILLPKAFDPAEPGNAEYLTDPEGAGYSPILMT